MTHKRIMLTILTAAAIFLLNESSSAQAFTCPTFSPQKAALTVKEIYKRVLEREADDGGLVLFSGKISGGGWCVQHVVRAIGVSPEYAERFIKDKTPKQAIVLMYRHFLLREPENEGVITHHVNELNVKGWQAKVLDFINSPEASATWSKFSPSALSIGLEGNTVEAQLVSSGCKFFLGRKGNYLCTTQKGYDLCELKRKDPSNGITVCQLPGIHAEADKALVGKGCGRDAPGEYTCTAKVAFDACEAFRNDKKVKVCRRTPIKIGDTK